MTVSLSKGQTVDLSKGGGLSRVRVGLGWDPVKKGGFLAKLTGGGGDIDLDASCILFTRQDATDVVWFRQLQSKDGSVSHSGDNRTGDGAGDDETILIDLDRLPAGVDGLAITVNSFQGQSFNDVENAFCRVIDEKNGSELCRFDLRDKGSFTGVLMGVLKRGSSGWSFKAVGEPGQGRTVQDLYPVAQRHL